MPLDTIGDALSFTKLCTTNRYIYSSCSVAKFFKTNKRQIATFIHLVASLSSLKRIISRHVKSDEEKGCQNQLFSHTKREKGSVKCVSTLYYIVKEDAAFFVSLNR